MWSPRRGPIAKPIPSSEITSESHYLERRTFLRAVAAAGVGAAVGGCFPSEQVDAATGEEVGVTPELSGVKPAPAHFKTDESLTPWNAATGYNNYYEFGTGKEDPARNAHTLKPEPWSVAIEGEVAKPGVIGLEDLVKPHELEERIYRHRCVEAWSMVIPWVGIPLGAILKRFEPTSKAKYVAFETLYDKEQMPRAGGTLPWPYREGLRMDEAMHPLTILAVGLYGRELPNQNGAPLRLVVPWKYGFKGGKSIVKITLRERRPRTTWESDSPREYGFFANVNPKVDHPRWSQRRERRIGEWTKRPTLMMNGYEEEVGSLYANMNLRKHF